MEQTMNKNLVISWFLLILIISCGLSWAATDVRLKDIARLKGVRDNQLIGYGLVVGLANTGDGNTNRATIQGIANMLENFGVQVNAQNIDAKNVAAVMVTSKLGPFAEAGDNIDVLVSSIGKAKSLQGGTLLLTPLKAPNGKVYAVAQGPLSVGGYDASSGRSSVNKNHPTVGFIPNGAIVEKGLENPFDKVDSLEWKLVQNDFTTATRVAKKINDLLPLAQATVKNGNTIAVRIPGQFNNKVIDFISQMEQLSIQTDVIAKVIINERTGALVMGGPIKIDPVIVAYAGIQVEIKADEKVSQPNPLSTGETKTIQGEVISVKQEIAAQEIYKLVQGNTVSDIVALLNTLGVEPRDMITILQMMKQAGALLAHIEVI